MATIVTTNSKKADLGGLHYCTNHAGKMSGLHSISTAVTVNPYCIKRQAKGDSICAHCFAASMMKQHQALNEATARNAEILTASILPVSVLPLIPTRYFRFEAFGDLINANQVINYFNIAKKNPDTLCALWTKNPQIISKAISMGYDKPGNLQIVLSSPFVNKAIKSTKWAFVDKIFTVYDKQAAKAVNINCGARSCLACGRCYRPNPDGAKIQYINEILK